MTSRVISDFDNGRLRVCVIDHIYDHLIIVDQDILPPCDSEVLGGELPLLGNGKPANRRARHVRAELLKAYRG